MRARSLWRTMAAARSPPPRARATARCSARYRWRARRSRTGVVRGGCAMAMAGRGGRGRGGHARRDAGRVRGVDLAVRHRPRRYGRSSSGRSAPAATSPCSSWIDCERLRFDSCTGASRALMRTRSFATGRLGAVQSLTALDTRYGPIQLAVATNGDAVFAWRDSGGVRARRLTRGALGPIISLTTEAAWLYEPAIGPGGDAVIAWMVGDIAIGKHLQARTLSASGALGPVLDIPTPGQGTGVPGSASAPAATSSWCGTTRAGRCSAAGVGEHVRRLLVRSASPASGRVGEIAEPWTAPGSATRRARDPPVRPRRPRRRRARELDLLAAQRQRRW